MTSATHTSASTRSRVEQDPRWKQLCAREEAPFFYAVKSTGIYCRPSCAARRPRPENVCFYSTTAEATRAGYRPCKRCQPEEPDLLERQTALVIALCRYIDGREAAPSLDELAAHSGLSPGYTQRLFKRVTGITPKAYAATKRQRHLREALRDGSCVTTALFNAGFNSTSRAYEHTDRLLGMTPSAFRSGAAQLTIRYATGPCSLGEALVATTTRGVCALLLGDGPGPLVEELAIRFPNAERLGPCPELSALLRQVIDLIERPGDVPMQLPLDIRGTAFQRQVWEAIRAVPPGRTTTYAELSRSLGQPRGARAVARACAQNAIALAIPCHRVVRGDGKPSGYAWGLPRKHALLAREAEQSRAGTRHAPDASKPTTRKP